MFFFQTGITKSASRGIDTGRYLHKSFFQVKKKRNKENQAWILFLHNKVLILNLDLKTGLSFEEKAFYQDLRSMTYSYVSKG